uniref:NADH:ubiquinone oxidoreductase intermediate-associated protein 30 domain-containing protein n=1 Tax=Haptolina brevifila TaxID=156173 RepID=A0A7S2BSK7_9EUKA|eukprot:CAMPEP_0174738628 /NCGR_PEP_ID=MMETSP1094-20130205/70270_1 /TAXON_ID=156173 /ORGANISM="Chrysochromulina brevifilum, Strain UTEX LB 985" /LENGTH=256 /DNA_ID=CAMNT_0015942079 /DNA_START=121 /DNA_END=891 /DNA_ORIENTATION=-
MDAARLITTAISVGAPLFNNGDHAGCAAVYSSALAELTNLAPAAFQPRVLEGINAATASRNDNDRAWALRHALDDVLARLRGGGSESSSVLDISKLRWVPVDDRVMGGSSRSRMNLHRGGAAFEGNLVVEGGGFASVRADLPSRGYGMAGATGLILRCTGDGRSGYKVSLRTDQREGVSYQAAFAAPSGVAVEVALPFAAFRASTRGRPVPDAAPLRGEDVCGLGIMLSRFDAQNGGVTGELAGPFRLEVHDIWAF